MFLAFLYEKLKKKPEPMLSAFLYVFIWKIKKKMPELMLPAFLYEKLKKKVYNELFYSPVHFIINFAHYSKLINKISILYSELLKI
jgi:cobalamin biosynthesis Co2+ chelatase CbiK